MKAIFRAQRQSERLAIAGSCGSCPASVDLAALHTSGDVTPFAGAVKMD
jgi:hypothetical protein